MSADVIDFAGLARALLERAHELVQRWLPNGVERNGRWYIGDFDGRDGESANVNLRTGQWIDNGAPDEDIGGDLTSLYARIRGMSNAEAARELIADFRWERDFLRPRPGAAPGGPHAAAPAAEPADPAEPPRERANAAAAAGEGERWRSVLPVPRHAPTPKRYRFGYRDKKAVPPVWVELEATRVWEYVLDGERFGYVCRFERVNSGGELVKDTVPLTWCEDTQDPHGGQRWHWKQWAAPRPLYVHAGLLGDARLVPVVLVEGEKCAQAGHELLGHEFDFVTWPGGCKAWPLARWSWLRGRVVYLWPDADAARQALTKAEREAGVSKDSKPLLPLAKQPGYQAMVRIGELLQAEHGCTVHMVHMPPPGERPVDGWDIADAVAEGWDAAKVRDYIRGAMAFRSPNDAVAAAAGNGGGASPPGGAAARAGEGADDGEPLWTWRDFLLCSEKGATRAVRENIVIALDGRPDRSKPGIEACAGLIRFNEFSNNVEKVRPTPWGTPAGEWLEADELLMGDWLTREHGMPSMARQALEEAVLVVARRHAYHPLRGRVEGLRGKWDRQDRLDLWLQRTCLDAEGEPAPAALQDYLCLAGRWFLMAMCARVMTERKVRSDVVVGPGVKFDYMLVLEGPQGWGKSTFAKTLGGDYFSDTGLDIEHKDSLMNIQGIWVYEWSELESLAKHEVGALKRFISSPVDRFRATFDRRPAKYPRQVVFVGTTNEQHYLLDLTGNRRFWPVRVTRPPDLEWLRDNLEQLLAEAVHRVDAGERFYPDRDEQKRLFDPQQQARTVESSLEASIRSYLYDENQRTYADRENGAFVTQITVHELLGRLGYSLDKQTDAVNRKACSVLNGLGWTTCRPAGDDKGHRPRAYRRPRELAAPASPLPDGSGASRGPTQGHPDTEAVDAPPF